jgi:hypothetical protein
METILTQYCKQYNSKGKLEFFNRGNLWLVLDSSEIFKNDVGQGTPAMVFHVDSRGHIKESSTYWCATGEGFVGDTYKLSDSQYAWLDGLEKTVTSFIEEN